MKSYKIAVYYQAGEVTVLLTEAYFQADERDVVVMRRMFDLVLVPKGLLFKIEE